MLCKTAHYCPKDKWLHESDVDLGAMTCRRCGAAVQSEMTKVSKTKLNTIDPDEVLNRHGADAMRLMVLSDTPPDRDQPWSGDGLDGAGRFLRRLWTAVHEQQDELLSAEPFVGDPGTLGGDDRTLVRAVHDTIRTTTEDYGETRHFNTAVARVFELTNAIKTAKGASPAARRLAYESVVKILAPITPHLCEELWCALGHEPSVVDAPWPTCDERALVVDEIEIVVQVLGKVRGRITVPADATDDQVREAALADENVASHLEGKTVRKVIVVPGRLVNIVAN
jgi:leucyl-tRNA synthetase